MNLSFKEDHISQIPALMLLEKLGYTYFTPAEAMELRGESRANVLLEPILRKQLEKINVAQVSSTRTVLFTLQNITLGIEALRDVSTSEGYITASQSIYDLLTAGKSLEQSVDGDKKSFTLQYIDWKDLKNNVFHVTEEFAVARTGRSDTYRPDIVLFVNGIPLCVIECKRPDIKGSISQAIEQHLRNQKNDGIRSLYQYSALLLSTATQSASYATTSTPEKFWAKWSNQFTSPEEERVHKAKLSEMVNEKRLNEKLFGERYAYVRRHFEELYKAPIMPSEQDEYLYSLCSPERLLDMMFNFTLYDDGIKKVARYQQYFAVRKTIERVRNIEGGKRKGGVIWHTQGSGKSLTMVLMAQAIVMDNTIKNPKIILVTDRTDLDRQITSTFRKCGTYVENAKTGSQLIELLKSKSDAVITTIINKFEAAVKGIRTPLTDPNIFVLIDEGHRSQYGEMGIKMEKTLPNACFIAMTGTPLMKKEKSTAQKFGGLIRPVYTVDQAVRDGAVVPLLYEGRMVPQTVHSDSIDRYFDKVCDWMSDSQKADMKRKFSRADQVNQGEQRIYAIAWDISQHFKENWQGSKFKAQLVAPRKWIAILYKQFLDEIGIVSSEVLITSPDTREGDEDAYGERTSREMKFWSKMMDEHGTAKKYEANIINRFKNSDKPEIIIVVDKLLTGFDEPKNTVLYLDRRLKEHTLLQAIARVNRVCDDKEYGYIIDYYGVLGELTSALDIYSDFDIEDLDGMFTNISDEADKLPQYHADLWAIFNGVGNRGDLEAYSEFLRKEDIRELFYDKLTLFAKSLKLALSSIDFHKQTPQDKIDGYKQDLKMFLKLRSSVQERYSDTIAYRQYEGQIQKLIDTHIESGEIEVITSLVNIFDKEKFAEAVERVAGTAAKADTIASRTAKYITENIEKAPDFYKKFSDMLKDTILAYEQGRISELEYLNKVNSIKESVLNFTDSEIPQQIADNSAAKAFFGLSYEVYKSLYREGCDLDLNGIALNTSLEIDRIIRSFVIDDGQVVIDWSSKDAMIGEMKRTIDDYLFDVVKRKDGVLLGSLDMDNIVNHSVDIAKKWFV
ncbi:MAG: HsdR family type I site-specific deoxyribonuclease [Rikenellaceae bacterium]